MWRVSNPFDIWRISSNQLRIPRPNNLSQRDGRKTQHKLVPRLNRDRTESNWRSTLRREHVEGETTGAKGFDSHLYRFSGRYNQSLNVAHANFINQIGRRAFHRTTQNRDREPGERLDHIDLLKRCEQSFLNCRLHACARPGIRRAVRPRGDSGLRVRYSLSEIGDPALAFRQAARQMNGKPRVPVYYLCHAIASDQQAFGLLQGRDRGRAWLVLDKRSLGKKLFGAEFRQTYRGPLPAGGDLHTAGPDDVHTQRHFTFSDNDFVLAIAAGDRALFQRSQQ